MSVMQIMPGLLALMAGGGGGGGSAADFTIEWWQKVENNSNNARPWSVGLYSTQILSLSYEGMIDDYFWINSGVRGNVVQNHVGAGWRHIAYVRSNGVVKGYVNGVQYTGNYPADQLITDTTTSLYVGTGEIAAGTYKGYITNLHIIKDVAKYLTNFTPPVLPTTAGLGSVMLLSAQDDGSKYTDSVGAKVPTLAGTVAWSSDTPFTATGPFTQYNNSWGSGSGGYHFDFQGEEYNGNLLNAAAGWTVSDGNGFRGTVTADAFLLVPGTIRIDIDFDPVGANTWTFTQPVLGGSLYFEGSSYLDYGGSVDWAMDVTTPAFWITPTSSIVNEGSSVTFNVSGLDVPNGTYYWTVTNGGDFGTSSGSFSMTSNSGSFSVTPLADVTTEGAETFTASVRTGSTSGTIVATSRLVTINDTSLSKVQLTSGTALGFNGTDNRHVIVADNLTDWNLGDNWTIEWWQKIPVDASGFLSVLCQDANVPTYSGIDVFVNAGNIQMFNGNLQFSEAAATRGEWNHIAIQKNVATGAVTAYINGVSRSISGPHPGTIAPSSPLNVAIGSRTYDGGANFYGQYFNGQLANIKISSVARYSTTFTPPTTVTTDANTVLALDGSVGSSGMLVDESGRHTITNNGATVDTIS
jgi:hypothetical protein